jgi:hypothetical protein
VLLDQPLRDKLKGRSYEQAKKFSWDESARQILNTYREVAGGKARIPTPESTEIATPRAVNS